MCACAAEGEKAASEFPVCRDSVGVLCVHDPPVGMGGQHLQILHGLAFKGS